MAGFMCWGQKEGVSSAQTKLADPRYFKAYAEGIQAVYAGKDIGDNPFPVGSWIYTAWDRGHASVEDPTGMLKPHTCAAERGTWDDGSPS